jgi:hypothetical protein
VVNIRPEPLNQAATQIIEKLLKMGQKLAENGE